MVVNPNKLPQQNHMIEWIHLVLGARCVRPRKDKLVVVVVSPGTRMHRWIETLFLQPLGCLIRACACAVEDVARFVFILFGVIPSLACIFIVLGITFHIPRIAATYACRPLVWFCWRHVCGKQSRGVGKEEHSDIHGSGDTTTTSRFCSGSCCSVCWLAVRISGGTFPGSGIVACCKCAKRVKLLFGDSCF